MTNYKEQRDALLEALKAYAPEDSMVGIHRDPDRCDPECEHCVVHGCYEDGPLDNGCGESDECMYRFVPHCDADCPYPLARTVIANVAASE